MTVAHTLTLGSLFDGIGGFPHAATFHGINPLWASEIEKFSIAVTTKHFPAMKHLGDITQIKGAEIKPVDIITFGSPCQDLSIAGKREGLAEGNRSGLFYHAIRIIREMRGATNGAYPRFAVWENVPGAFTSNAGQDFRTVLEEISESAISMPKSGKWANAGMVRGNGRSIAWRVLDAQHWGIPQRRKRIFLVADFAGESAGEILFEPQSMSRNFEESREKREKVASDVRSGIESTGTYHWGNDGRIGGWIERPDKIFAYQSDKKRSTVQEHVYHKKNGTADSLTQQKQYVIATAEDGVPCINDQATGKKLILFEPRSQDGIPRIHMNVVPTLNTAQGGQRQPCIAIFTASQYAQYREGFGTLRTSGGDNGGGSESLAVTSIDCRNLSENEKLSATLQSKCSGGYSLNFINPIRIGYTVRRLTVTECLRLQGFPDWWFDGVPGYSDTAGYKACGNSVAVPCVSWVLGQVYSAGEWF